MRRKRRAARPRPPSGGPQFNVKTLGRHGVQLRVINRLDMHVAGRTPTWGEIRIALDHGWIGPAVAIQVAAERIESAQSTHELVLLSELAIANPEQPIARLVDDLMSTEAPTSVESSRHFWSRIALITLWDRRTEYDDPLRAVSDLYCDFDHPPDWYDFIYYHPPALGYDPSAHSRDENIARLFRLWGEHVESLRGQALAR